MLYEVITSIPEVTATVLDDFNESLSQYFDPTTGVYGWKCDDGQNAGTTQTYTVTVSGHVGETNTDYSVKGGTYYAVGATTGPGAPIVDTTTFSISGLAYLDMNSYNFV